MIDKKKSKRLPDDKKKILRDLGVNGLKRKKYSGFEEGFIRTFSKSPLAMTITALDDGRIVYVNKSFLRATGYRQKEIIGKNSVELNMVSEKERAGAVAELNKKGSLENYSIKTRIKSGEILDATWTADKVKINNQDCLLSLFIDNTDLRMAEKKIKEYNDRLSILLDLNRAILEVRSPQEIADAAFEQIIKLIPCQCITLAIIDFATDEIKMIASKETKGYELNIDKRMAMEPYKGYVERLKTGEIIVARDYSTFNQESEVLLTINKIGFHSSISVPLIYHEELIGTLNFYSNSLNYFTKEYIDIANEIARPLAIAVQQSILNEKLREGQERLDALSRQLVETQEKERYHIAQEVLHDGIGQDLTVLKMDLFSIKRLKDQSKVKEKLDSSLKILEKISKEVHDLAIDLRPPIIDDFGLVPTLEWLVNRYEERMDQKFEFYAEPFEEPLVKEIETTCFRVAQEALTNIVRHSKAKNIKVELSRQDGELILKVIDDGIGFNLKDILKQSIQNNNLGLVGMQERVRLNGGKLEIKSASGKGTCIKANFPLSQQK